MRHGVCIDACDASMRMRLKERAMGSIIICILLAVTFIGFIVFAMRGGSLTVSFFAMAVLWTGIYFLAAAFGLAKPFNFISDIFSTPALNYGGTAVQIIFGAWFGRVLVDTGIAAGISRLVVRAGKDRSVIATILIALVTCLIFSSAYGVGSAVAIGSILFPIMASIGVPKKIAVPVFTLSIGAAMWINSVLFVQFQPFFQGYKSPDGSVVEWGAHYLRFGTAAMAIQMIGIIVFILVNRKAIRNGQPYEVAGAVGERDWPKVPAITYVLPVLPATLSIVLNWPAVPALLLSTLLAFALTGGMKTLKGFIEELGTTAKTAIGDIGGLLILLFCLTMFQASAIKVVGVITPLLAHVIPNNEMILVVVVLILAPLALFRGPLELYGAGAATVTLLLGLGTFNAWFLYALMVIPSMIGISSCFTQSWNAWSLEYSGLDAKTFLLKGVPVAWISSVFIMGAAAVLLF